MSVHPNFVASASAAANAPTARVAASPVAARSAPLKRFEREQVVVEYLNRGVSVVEIAARIGVGEKRALIREILARRMPHPPAEFVAIQVSRLNEALLVAYSAMAPTNLKAVAQVVEIVRELDRYGGAFAAEWARPEASGRDAPSEEDAAFARAWLCGDADPELEDDDALFAPLAPIARPEIPAQGLEKVHFAPGFSSLTPNEPTAIPAEGPRPAVAAGCSSLSGRAHPQGEAEPARERPEIPAQGLEKAHFAPGFSSLTPNEPTAIPAEGPRPAVAAGCSSLSDRAHPQGEAEPARERPEVPAQSLEKAHFAPGFSPLAPTEPATDRAEGPGPSLAAVAASLPDRAHAAGEAEPAGERPENPAQPIENAQSAPGFGTTAGAASSAPAPTSDPVLSLLNGAAGCAELAAAWSMLPERDAWRRSLA